MLSYNIDNYLIKGISERHIIIEINALYYSKYNQIHRNIWYITHLNCMWTLIIRACLKKIKFLAIRCFVWKYPDWKQIFSWTETNVSKGASSHVKFLIALHGHPNVTLRSYCAHLWNEVSFSTTTTKKSQSLAFAFTL